MAQLAGHFSGGDPGEYVKWVEGTDGFVFPTMPEIGWTFLHRASTDNVVAQTVVSMGPEDVVDQTDAQMGWFWPHDNFFKTAQFRIKGDVGARTFSGVAGAILASTWYRGAYREVSRTDHQCYRNGTGNADLDVTLAGVSAARLKRLTIATRRDGPGNDPGISGSEETFAGDIEEWAIYDALLTDANIDTDHVTKRAGAIATANLIFYAVLLSDNRWVDLISGVFATVLSGPLPAGVAVDVSATHTPLTLGTVTADADAVTGQGVASEALTAGDAIYFDTTSGGFRRAFAAGGQRAIVQGFTMDAVASGNPVAFVAPGKHRTSKFTTTATLTPGDVFALSAVEVGQIVPANEAFAGGRLTLVGYASGVNEITVEIEPTGEIVHG